VGWTLVMLVLFGAMAGQALWSISAAQQACFANYPAVSCPGGDDPAVVRLTLAFLGAPLVWALGVAGLVLWARRRRDSPDGHRRYP
jgi:hypothetical protein